MLEKAYEANPKSLNDFGGELYYTKGRIYESIGKIKDAEIDYKKCLELESKNIDCNTSLFNILLSKKDFKGALRILETIIVISPNVEYSNMREKLLKVIKG